MMREVILIPMRLGSSRLPGKGLLPIGSVSALELLVRRLQRAKRPSETVLCTTTEPEDLELMRQAEALGIRCFQGEKDDVLVRLTRAAEWCGAECVAEVDGDDVLCDPEYLDAALGRANVLDADYFAFQDLPFGLACNVVKTAALTRACEQKDVRDTSTGIFNFLLHSGRFRVIREQAPGGYHWPKARFTLDYPEDLEFLRAVVGEFPEREFEFRLDELLALLGRHRELIRINAGLEEAYWQHFRSKQSSAKGRARPQSS